MHFVQSGGMATIPRGDAAYDASFASRPLTWQALRDVPRRRRAEVLDRVTLSGNGAQDVLRLCKDERVHKLMRTWITDAIAQDDPGELSVFRTLFSQVQMHTHTHARGRLSKNKAVRRLQQTARLVKPDHLERRAWQTFLPHIVDDLCAHGLLAKQDVPVCYIRSEQKLIDALNNGYLTPAQYRQVPCRQTIDVRELMRQGVVHFTKSTFACLQPWTWPQLVKLAGRDAFRWRCLIAWQTFSFEEIEVAVADQLLHVAHLNDRGPNLQALLEALTDAGHLDAATAMHQGASLWDPHVAWPGYAATYVRRFDVVSELIKQMPLPDKGRNTDRNRHYALRLVAHWFVENRQQAADAVTESAPVGPSAWNRLRIYLRGGNNTGELQPVQGPLLSACVVCCESFSEILLPSGFAACLHLPTMDVTCLHRGIVAFDAQRCPEHGCERRLGPDEVLDLGLSSERADAAACAVVQDAYANKPNWHFCRTPQCPNGLEVQGGQNKRFHCRCCGKVSVFSKTRWTSQSLSSLSDADKHHLAVLIDGVRASRRGPTPAVRECFHCGSATQLIDGCNSVRCGTCHHVWNFKWGQSTRHDFSDGAQMYIPRRGWLARLGLYYGADSETGQDAYAVICQNMSKQDLESLAHV